MAGRQSNYLLVRHAFGRALERGVAPGDVRYALTEGEPIEYVPPAVGVDSGVLFFYQTSSGRPIHVKVVEQVRPARNQYFVVTVYEPDLEHFEADLKTRRRRGAN